MAPSQADVATSSDETLELGTDTYAALYEHWERNQWSALSVDLARDAASFQALDGTSRDALIWIFAHRFHAEFNVARLLATFLAAAPSWNLQLLLATQVADEHRHLRLVLRVYEEVFEVEGAMAAVRELADRNLDFVADTLYGRLDDVVTRLALEPGEATFLQGWSRITFWLRGWWPGRRRTSRRPCTSGSAPFRGSPSGKGSWPATRLVTSASALRSAASG
jgi:hypothetical protein